MGCFGKTTLSRIPAGPRAHVTAWIVLASPVFCQTNDLPLYHSEQGNWLLLSNPSVGAPAGTFPPDLSGDCVWKILPGDRVLAYSGAGEATLTLNGLLVYFADSDSRTTPWLYDFTVGPALPSPSHPGALEPAFLQQGLTTEIFVSLGSTGLEDPCTMWMGKFYCEEPGCAFGGPGGLQGWIFNISFDQGIPIPSDGTTASDLALTWFVPGGMTIGDPLAHCPGGDFVLQTLFFTSETQADDLGGISAFGGRQVAGLGPLPNPVNETIAAGAQFAERILNVVADSGTGFGFERGSGNGGATNALKLSAGSGQARLSYEVRAAQDAGVPNQAFVATALSALPLPGVPVLGAHLLVAPDGLFAATVSASASAAVSVQDACHYLGYICWFESADGAADFVTQPFGGGSALHLDVPAAAVGLDLFSQGLVLHTATLQAFSTNRVRTSLLP